MSPHLTTLHFTSLKCKLHCSYHNTADIFHRFMCTFNKSIPAQHTPGDHMHRWIVKQIDFVYFVYLSNIFCIIVLHGLVYLYRMPFKINHPHILIWFRDTEITPTVYPSKGLSHMHATRNRFYWQRLNEIRAWITHHDDRLCNIITYAYHNFNGGLNNMPLKWGLHPFFISNYFLSL